MREIFTSGSSRGEWVVPFTGSPSLLLYRYASPPENPETSKIVEHLFPTEALRRRGQKRKSIVMFQGCYCVTAKSRVTCRETALLELSVPWTITR